MISYQVYKLVHFLGLFMLLLALGGVLLHRITDGAKAYPWRRVMLVTHGVGLFLVLLGGFGMLARLGLVAGLPGWVHAKLGIWVALGCLIAAGRLKPQLAKACWWVGILLAVAAAYLAIMKPF